MLSGRSPLTRCCVTLLFAFVSCASSWTSPAAAALTDPVVRSGVDIIALLLPDGADTADPRITVWLDAAREEGLHLQPLTDSQFLQQQAAGSLGYAGVIMPDQVHITASDALVSAIQSYASGGGTLMLVYDAGVQDQNGFYPASGPSRFSPMVGTAYADYAACYPNCDTGFIALINATAQVSALRNLRVPPGKSMPLTAAPLSAASAESKVAAQAGMLAGPPPQAPGRPADRTQYYVPVKRELPSGLAQRPFDPNPRAHPFDNLPLDKKPGPPLTNASLGGAKAMLNAAATDPVEAISGYVYGMLTYPSFVTADAYSGTRLVNGNNTTLLVAGVNPYGSGRVLFVNTPLGYLKGYGTDGLLLHGMLHYFAVDMLGLPYVVGVPKGKAGLVANVHVDCADALEPMQELKDAGVWKNGPFSVHFTAGPDCVDFGDNLGLNVPGNPVTQSWVRYFDSLGYRLGNHGGWIHDYYGDYVSETNQSTFQQYLELNDGAMSSVLGKPLVEYSAPQGNNPKWAVAWAEQRGVVGYYTTANTGMAPTRTYRDGQLDTKKIWSIPVSPYHDVATFEEFEERNIAGPEATAWLQGMVDFAVQRRTSRMVYFHPPGAADYLATVLDWMSRAKSYGNRFSWYTFADLATFLSRREVLSWQLSKLASGALRVDASHPSNLNAISWSLSKALYSRPAGLSGCTLVDDPINNEWIVIGSAGARSATFTITRLR